MWEFESSKITILCVGEALGNTVISNIGGTIHIQMPKKSKSNNTHINHKIIRNGIEYYII